MKDRIVFFIIGAITATLAFIIGSMKEASVSAQDTATKVDSLEVDGDVLIKGTLIIGEKPNHILLKSDEKDSTVLILRNDSTAVITAADNKASMALSSEPAISENVKIYSKIIPKDIPTFRNTGIILESERLKDGLTSRSYLILKYTEGTQIIYSR